MKTKKEIPARRILYISTLSIFNALLVGLVSKALIYLIALVTGLFFYGKLSVDEGSPAHNHLGYWVIVIPVVGGLLVGLMARFGSKAIRGHGIPEAMEKILTDESKIHPLVTFLKPLSAAVSIGTGGPFGAEGPIISTGGAIGSLCGQLSNITSRERKILLAAGAAAGMTAIFGTPLAAILLAIELLLFEFSATSIIPVAAACVTGDCMHVLLFGSSPTFPMPDCNMPDNYAILAYSIIGILIGFISVIVTKTVYLIEDGFEKLSLHWMWWPALGGFVVGVIGYYFPQTLGVGYENITNELSGKLTVSLLMALCIWKFISWSVALGSGTSGGTLAPLLTIGGAIGCLLGKTIQHFFPEAHISCSLAALVSMSALFAGSARALLTSIVFALEVTMQERTLLPLIAGCTSSFLISFAFMRTTIMTEKIVRRGVFTPDSYTPDILQSIKVADVMSRLPVKKDIYSDNTVSEKGSGAAMNAELCSVYPDDTLQLVLKLSHETGQDLFPVIDKDTRERIGTLYEKNIVTALKKTIHADSRRNRHLLIKMKWFKSR